VIPSANPFEHFPSRVYLEKYYSYVGEENGAMLGALAEFARGFEPHLGRFVEVGGGPSIVPILALCATLDRSPESITFTDISQKNLEEAACWLNDRPTAFDYRAVLQWLASEHGLSITDIEHLARSSDWSFPLLDLRKRLPEDMIHAFDTVSSHFFAESATDDLSTLLVLLKRIADLAAPGATVFLSFMRNSEGYSLDGFDFPAFAVNENLLGGLLKDAGLDLTEVRCITAPAETPPTRNGYDGMVFVGGITPGTRARAARARRARVPAVG
jgi:hypothetical protein